MCWIIKLIEGDVRRQSEVNQVLESVFCDNFVASRKDALGAYRITRLSNHFLVGCEREQSRQVKTSESGS